MWRIQKTGLMLIGLVMVAQTLLYLFVEHQLWTQWDWQQLMMNWTSVTFWLTILSLIVGVFGVYLFIKGLMVPTLTSKLRIAVPDGEMTVSKQAVNSMVIKSLARNFNLLNVESEVKLFDRGHKADISIRAYHMPANDLTRQAKTIQTQVQHDVEQLLGIQVRRVKLDFEPKPFGEKVQIS
ncbi:alkaline shock response membrane anchor protein AmaP [Lapidilactobacillus mulanensis]|uniref:Alkaline shock response membrane anchor protein AmaP n=1 Tax=Lapidilactobacillus mulanensis TaxID=2485999 RepID=A0ABW4DP31_9LACO|nr:alkaline shock response membrane anchor protein AmaP [Lapidilactobacillus mulanensis]